jgi:WASH complex subunit strumpellin
MSLINKFTKLYPACMDHLMKIGQMQLLRTKICYELNNAAKFDSKHLFHALSTFNKSLMSEIEAHFEDPNNPYPDEENPLLYELNPYLECIGISEPLKKIYISTNKSEAMPIFLSSLIISQLPKLPVVKLNGNFCSQNYILSPYPKMYD